jgi:putative spermidine/putrescine transport system permease protein
MMRSGWGLRLAVGLILAFTLAPILVVMATSFTTTAYPVFPPRGFTLKWFMQFLHSDTFMASTRISLVVALCTAALASVLGVMAALALNRADLPGRDAIATLMMAPAVFPAIVLGVAILIFYHAVGGSGTLAGIVAAHVLVTTPFVIRMVLASLARLDPALAEAAQNLGGGRARVLFRITLPLIRPGIVAGALCAFLLSFDELVITLFIAGPGHQTLPVRVFAYLEYTSDPMIAAISTLFTLLTVVLGVPLYLALLPRDGR